MPGPQVEDRSSLPSLCSILQPVETAREAHFKQIHNSGLVEEPGRYRASGVRLDVFDMTYFTTSHEARRYSQSRPYFHPLAISKAAAALGIDQAVPAALDVACGTGQSAEALTAISRQVVGFDISRGMLEHAPPNPRVRYVNALAERMPFRSGSFYMATCALAFHWFDRDRFYREVSRVLRPGGMLVIYNNGFTGRMRDNPAFLDWSGTVYPARFPTPPRDSRPIAEADAAAAGFDWIEEDRYANEVVFTPDGLAAYLMTQTNVAAALAGGRETVETVEAWLLEQITPFFSAEEETCIFVTRAWYLRKAAALQPDG